MDFEIISALQLALLIRNCFTRECKVMNSVSCFKMYDPDRSIITLSLIECNCSFISLAAEIAAMNDPNASVKKHAKYRNTKKHITN